MTDTWLVVTCSIRMYGGRYSTLVLYSPSGTILEKDDSPWRNFVEFKKFSEYSLRYLYIQLQPLAHALLSQSLHCHGEQRPTKVNKLNRNVGRALATCLLFFIL